MSTRSLIILLVPLVLLAGFLLALGDSKCKGFKCGQRQSVSSGIIFDGEVERVVQEFGQEMKRVSLLAPETELRASMQSSYGAYVVPELIEAWLADPSSAPGRQTSSPWPDRIQIGNMEGDARGFVVNGTVVEVIHDEQGEDIVGTYPVKLRLEKRDGEWLIYYFEKGSYAVIPSRGTVTGTYTCLPHRDTTGPQTLECAFGIREDGSGEHYSIDTHLMASTIWMDIPTGARVRVEGVITPIENLSSDHWQKYDIVGIISATSMQRI